MASASVVQAGSVRAGALLLASAAANGSPSHPYFASAPLINGPEAARNLADAVHLLCALHGRHPGVLDMALGRAEAAESRRWLIEAADAFHAERSYLTRLAVAAGPIPGTPGGGGSEAVVIQQRAALATLAGSERKGCALGAALALIVDWSAVRAILDKAAERMGVDSPPSLLPDVDAARAEADLAGTSRAAERALLFGAEQTFVQHRGLWDLLESRQQARRGI